MVKRAAVSRGGAHVLAFSAGDSCKFGVLRRLDPADLSKNVARGCELFRLDFNFVRDLPDFYLSSIEADAQKPNLIDVLNASKDISSAWERDAGIRRCRYPASRVRVRI